MFFFTSQRTFTKVLPPVIKEPEWFITDEDHFQTTTGSTHDYKFQGGRLSHPSYKKAPGSWKVHYVEDTIGKVCLAQFEFSYSSLQGHFAAKLYSTVLS